jgi:hypothetical protein
MSEKTSCISHPPKSTFVAIRIDYVAICQNSPDAACSAALLSYFENWMNTKLDNRPQAKLRNKIDQNGGKAGTQDESLWVYISQDNLKKDLLGVFGDVKINKCLQWLRTMEYILWRENPDHLWDRKLQYMLNVEFVQKLINEAASEGQFIIKLSKASKKPLKSVKTNAREDDNNEAIAKNVLDSQLDSELELKDSSSLPEEAAPSNAAGETLPEEALPEPVVEELEAPIIQAEELPIVIENADAVVEESASQLEAPESSDILPVIENAEPIFPVTDDGFVAKAAYLLGKQVKHINQDMVGEAIYVTGTMVTIRYPSGFVCEWHADWIGVAPPQIPEAAPIEEQSNDADVAAVIAEATEVIADKPKKVAMPRERDRIFDGVAKISFGIDAKLSDDNPDVKALLEKSGKRIGKITKWLKSLSVGVTAEMLWAFAKWYKAKFGGIDLPRDKDKFEEHFTAYLQTLGDKPKTESRIANAQKPPSEADMTEVDWEDEERKYQESIRGQQKSNVPA